MPKYRSRILVEECHHLDVNRLNRDHALIPGTIVKLGWGQETTAVLHVWSDFGHRSRAGGFDIDDVETIRLTWTPCNYGGNRPWFLCPHCLQRCAKLLDYRDHGFRCRRCYGAGYAIENDTSEWRLRRQIKKLESRLDDDYERPKGMHHRTYQRLCDAITELEMAAEELFVQKVIRRWPDLLVS